MTTVYISSMITAHNTKVTLFRYALVWVCDWLL